MCQMICVSDDGGCRTEGRVMVGNAMGGQGGAGGTVPPAVECSVCVSRHTKERGKQRITVI